MIIPIELQVVKFNIPFIAVGLYIIAILITYFLLFHKHHKRNQVKIYELIELLTKFFAVVTLTLIIILVGIDCIMLAKEYSDTRVDVIVYVSIGIAVISFAIINLIFYIQKKLKDFDPVLREEDRKHNLKVGEVLELIMFLVLMTTPIWRIPALKALYNPDDNKEFFKATGETVAISVASIILLFVFNPLNIKGKLFKKKDKEEIESKEEKAEEKEEVIEEKNQEEKKPKKEVKKEEKKETKKESTKTKTTKKSNNKTSSKSKGKKNQRKKSKKGKK